MDKAGRAHEQNDVSAPRNKRISKCLKKIGKASLTFFLNEKALL